MDVTSIARWREMCTALGLRKGLRKGLRDFDQEHRRLLRAWRSWGRHYHTLRHLTACLEEFDGARALALKPAEVELALWFHDAVYRTYRSDNEARSAEWAAQFLTVQGASETTVSNVRELVMATAHTAEGLTGDAALVVDIDLSILGQPPDVYDEFERNVRREYWWVPKRRFVTARRAILQSFLTRPSIYHWPLFRDRYEATARANLDRAIQAML